MERQQTSHADEILGEILERRAKARCLTFKVVSKFGDTEAEFEHLLPEGLLKEDDRRDWVGNIIKAASKELSKVQNIKSDLLYAQWACLAVFEGDGRERCWWACSEPFIYKLGTRLANVPEASISAFTIRLCSMKRVPKPLNPDDHFSKELQDHLVRATQRNHVGLEYLPAVHIRAVLGPSCVARLHSEQRWRDYDKFQALEIFKLPENKSKQITHHSAKLLAAWLLADLDLTVFWTIAQNHAEFSDRQVALRVQTTSQFDQLFNRQPGFRQLKEQYPDLKTLLESNTDHLKALNKAWRIVTPFRIVKKYKQYVGQVVPTRLMSSAAFSGSNSIQERVVRLEPGYQHFHEVGIVICVIRLR